MEKEMFDHDERVYHFYRWPENASDTIEYNISKFQIEDEGIGGKASLYSGGVGKRHVVFYLQSKVGKGLEFKVVVYGYEHDKNP